MQCDLDGVADALAGRPGFDTVVMNPPFGTKHNKGLDVRFVETALQCVTDKVFLLPLSTSLSTKQSSSLI